MSSSDANTSPSPVLHFILGPPCAGKSTLAKHLTNHLPSLRHLSVGALFRALVVPSNSLASLPGISELPTLDTNTKEQVRKALDTHTLLEEATTAYILHTTISSLTNCPSTSTDQPAISVLVDGFPRSTSQWPIFKQYFAELWKPSSSTVVIIIDISREEAHRRFKGRRREGDEFNKRFDEYEQSIGGIQGILKQEGVKIIQVSEKENKDLDELVRIACEKLKGVAGWRDVEDN